MQMQQYIEELEAEAAEKVEEHLKDVAESTYTDTAKTVEECAPDMSVSVDFDKINPDIVDEVVNKPWATDGKGFSDRLGYDKERLVEELNKAVAQGLLRGQSPEEIAAGLVKQLGISQRNATRIVRTETAAIASKSDMKLYKDLGIDSIKFMASLDGKTCAVCSDMDGKVIPLKQCRIGLNMPPLHPNCRCYTVPVTGLEDETDIRKARSPDGSYTEVTIASTANTLKNGIIKLDKVIKGHSPAPKKSEPNSVIDHLGVDGKTETRTFYDENGLKSKEITNHDHGNQKQHHFGEHGEHVHEYTWDESGGLKKRTYRELTDEERKENGDIL